MAKKDKKDVYYFSHDYNPTSDPKMLAFVGEFGAIGYGVYWRIVEMLHESKEHVLPLKKYIYSAIAKQMLIDVEQVLNVVEGCINDYELFETDDEYFWCNRVLRNVEKRIELIAKKVKAGEASAKKRQEKKEAEENATRVQQTSTDVKHNSTECNKLNEIKLNETIIKETIDSIITVNKKEKNNKKKKTNVITPNANEQQMFEQARVSYLGSKAGLQTELNNFVKKYPDEWQTILPLLLPAIAREKIDKAQKLKNNNFNQQWKNFSTWINQKCWEIEYPNVTQSEVDSSLKVTTNSNGEQKTEIKEDRSSYPMYQTLKYNPELFPEGTESRCGYWIVKHKQCVRTNKY